MATPDLSVLPKVQAQFIPPMLAKLTETPPDGSQWRYEIKLDGYRAVIVKRGKNVEVFSRRHNQISHKFPVIASAFERLAPDTALDGEIVALDDDGRPDFNNLQNWKKSAPIYFYAFDLPIFKGRDLRGLPLTDRRALLQKALRGLNDPVRFSPTFDIPVADLVRTAREQGLEGIVAKRKDSRYETGERSGAWLKYKTHRAHEFVIGGYLPGSYVFDSLVIGYHKDGKLLYVSRVRNGFTPSLRMQVAKHFKGLETTKCPFANLPESGRPRFGQALTADVMKECHWLKPKLRAEFEFADWTKDDHLRHGRFVALG